MWVGRVILAAVLLQAVLGCCSAMSPSAFEQLSLDTQIAKWREIRARGCDPIKPALYFDAMSRHGMATANAMVPFLRTPDSSFPRDDAAFVVAYVATEGVDLRNHPATHLLRQIADERDESNAKYAAIYAISMIEGDYNFPKQR